VPPAPLPVLALTQKSNRATAIPQAHSKNIRLLVSLGGAALKKHKNEHIHSLTNPLMQEPLLSSSRHRRRNNITTATLSLELYPTIRGYNTVLGYKTFYSLQDPPAKKPLRKNSEKYSCS